MRARSGRYGGRVRGKQRRAREPAPHARRHTLRLALARREARRGEAARTRRGLYGRGRLQMHAFCTNRHDVRLVKSIDRGREGHVFPAARPRCALCAPALPAARVRRRRPHSSARGMCGARGTGERLRGVCPHGAFQCLSVHTLLCFLPGRPLAGAPGYRRTPWAGIALAVTLAKGTTLLIRARCAQTLERRSSH